MRPDVRLAVDGTRYGGWQRVRVRRSIEQIAGTFELAVTERWAGQDTPRPIRPGAECRVLIDGEAVITGHVDDVAVRYDSGNHSVTVRGRDQTGDLVDCSAPSVQWNGRTLLDVARELCRPYGIPVRADVDAGGRFERLKHNEGDSVFETLEAAARIRAVLLVSDGRGGLVITRASTRRIGTALVLGENVLSCQGEFSHRDRYSEYRVLGQRAGTDEHWGEQAAQIVGTAKDDRVTRHRPLTVLAEDQVDAAAAKERAEWERNVRWGRSQRITYTVQGWRHRDGLWAPNVLISVRDPYLGLAADRLIAGVAFVLDEDGLRTELTVMPREAFERIPLPEPSDGGMEWTA